jgi:hypothetical protein
MKVTNDDEFKRKMIDEVAKEAFGTTRTEALRDGKCVGCGTTRLIFRDIPSQQEFHLTALCQKCQDAVFGTGDE